MIEAAAAGPASGSPGNGWRPTIWLPGDWSGSSIGRFRRNIDIGPCGARLRQKSPLIDAFVEAVQPMFGGEQISTGE